MQESEELLQKYTAAVDARLSGKRLEHVHSVSEYAAYMAGCYGVNEFDARVAGLLHDWDKLLVDEEFPARLEELGIEPPEQIELLYPALHSFTGAKAVEREFPELEPQIIKAIWNHTVGSLEMSDLEMVVFIADMIEPLRKVDKRPMAVELRKKVGKVPLDQLYFESYVETMNSLIVRRRPIHPCALEVWNGLCKKYHPHPGKRNQGNPDVVL